MLQTSDLEKYDRNCHFKSDNYILMQIMPMPLELTGGAFRILPALSHGFFSGRGNRDREEREGGGSINFH